MSSVSSSQTQWAARQERRLNSQQRRLSYCSFFAKVFDKLKEDSFVFDITGRHYNATNSDVSLALPPVWGWREERDDISDYALRAAKATG